MKKTIYSAHQEALRAKLIAIREGAGLTQRDLAKRLGRARSVVAYLELGQRRLDMVEFYAICKACGVSPKKISAELMDAYERLDRTTKRR